MKTVGYHDLRGWTDGPKFVIDMMRRIDWSKVPKGVHGVSQSNLDGVTEWVVTIARDFPYMEFFIVAPQEDVEQLATMLPNIIIHNLKVDDA